jgi:hypothetical protein
LTPRFRIFLSTFDEKLRVSTEPIYFEPDNPAFESMKKQIPESYRSILTNIPGIGSNTIIGIIFVCASFFLIIKKVTHSTAPLFKPRSHEDAPEPPCSNGLACSITLRSFICFCPAGTGQCKKT